MASSLPPCTAPHTVEWRIREAVGHVTSEQKLPRGQTGARAAVCLLGLARFVDWTYQSMEKHLLQRVGVPYDLFGFVSAGREPASCQNFHDFEKTPPVMPYPELGFPTFSILLKAVQATVEWAALVSILHRAVAARVDWSDRPVDYLNSSNTWRQSLRRPGGWIGGVTHDNGEIRPASGLMQLRALQWCADSVSWHEQHALGSKYTYLIFARWDMQWAVPFPGVPLLSALDPNAVWVPNTQSAFFRNDRFAVVPRRCMGPYFEGWKLVASGEADKAIAAVFPHSGVPVYDAELVSTEGFLHARLTYAGVHTAGLPTMAFVQCLPGESSRSRSHLSCTSFSEIFGGVQPGGWNDDATRLLGGAKYPAEVDGILLADYVIHVEEFRMPLANKLLKRIAVGTDAEWTEQALHKAAALTEDVEIEQLMKGKWCVQDAWTRGFIFNRGCRDLRQRTLELGKQNHALALARSAVLAAPLVLENWLWLMLMLANPPVAQRHAAAAALAQAYALNPAHPAVQGMAAELASEPHGAAALADALGDANASRDVAITRERTRRLLLVRRTIQKECVRTRLPSRTGLHAWLRYGEHFRQSRWLAAAVGVLVHLERSLADGRPEAQRHLPEAPTRVRRFAARLSAKLEDMTATPWLAGLTLPILRYHAPSANDLLDPAWLSYQESLSMRNGKEGEAVHFMNDFFRADSLRKMSEAMCFGPECSQASSVAASSVAR